MLCLQEISAGYIILENSQALKGNLPQGYFFSSSVVFIKVIVMTQCYTGQSGNAPTKYKSEEMGGYA